MKNKFRAIFFNTALVFVSIVATLLVLEIVMRIIGMGYLPLRRVDSLLGVSFIPNAKYKHDSEGHSEGKINSRGLRDHEIEYVKKEGEKRVLLLGDSFMEALQVDLDNSFPKLLQKFLNDKFSSDTLLEGGVTVVNGGRGGMGTAEQYLWYKTEGVKYDPDLVILAFYLGNDFRDNSKALTGASALKPYIVFDADSFTVDLSFRDSRAFMLHTLLQPIFENSILATETARRFNRIKNRARDATVNADSCLFDFNVFNDTLDSVWSDAYSTTRKLIALLADEVASNLSRFVIMLIPDSYQTERFDLECVKNRDLRKPNRFLNDVASSLGIPLFDLTDIFETAYRQNGVHYYGFGEFLGNGHWNENGHDAAARAMANYLLLSELVTQ